jgi:peroxiredoxin
VTDGRVATGKVSSGSEHGCLMNRPIGRSLPVGVRLNCYMGVPVDLQELGGNETLVIYSYPGCVCSPEDGYESPLLDAMQHRAFADCGSVFRATGCRPVGISSQSVEGQRRAAADTRATHMLLSDPDLRLARALGLGTFNVDGADWYCRMTLVVVGGIVAETFSPRGARATAQAIAWLRAQGF